MKKIGIFGGSFNPIHVGHVSLARQLLQAAGLDEVWLMVSPQNPWKQGRSDLLDDRQRYELACRALEGETGIVASDYELRLPKPSYTWNTLQHLSTDYPDHRFTLMVGGDNWAGFSNWYHADDILANYPIVVYPRRGSDFDLTQLPSGVTVVEAGLLDISSTEVRRRVRNGESISGLVPPSIEEEVKHLYYHTSVY